MIKKRNWGAVVYPDSAPSDWLDILKLKGLSFAVSPLHDKDINPTGEVKKAHYHIILCFPGPTTDKTVNQIMEELNQPIAIALESVRGYYRYFTHKDNPEKFQYDEKDIKVYNGFDVCDILNNFEVYQYLKEIQLIILEQEIFEYSDLMDYLLSNDLMELWNVSSSHTLFLNTYITSKRHKNEVKNVIISIIGSCIFIKKMRFNPHFYYDLYCLYYIVLCCIVLFLFIYLIII